MTLSTQDITFSTIGQKLLDVQPKGGDIRLASILTANVAPSAPNVAGHVEDSTIATVDTGMIPNPLPPLSHSSFSVAMLVTNPH